MKINSITKCVLSTIFAMVVYSNVIVSQIAMTVGYHYSAGKFDAINELIERSNTKFMPNNKAWSSIKGMNGLSLGLKYRFGNFGLNAGWRYLFSIKSAKGLTDGSTNSFDWQWNVQNNSYNFGIEGFVSNYFSLGFDVLWDGYRLYKKENNIDEAIPLYDKYLEIVSVDLTKASKKELAEAYLNKGKNAILKDDKVKAKEFLNKVLEFDAENKEAKDLLSSLAKG